MRTFVAVELNERCRGALVEAVQALRPLGRGVRWVGPDSLHLTLKFIGDLSEVLLPAAIRSLDGVAERHGAVSFVVGGLSAFPPRGVPRIVHVEVEEPTGALERLQADVERVLADDLSIAPEGRRYVAHITLGRVKNPRDCPRIEEMQAAVAAPDFGAVDADSFVLMMSELKPSGAVYSVLHRFPLATGTV